MVPPGKMTMGVGINILDQSGEIANLTHHDILDLAGNMADVSAQTNAENIGEIVAPQVPQ